MLHLVSGDVMAAKIRAAGLLRPFDPATRETRDPDAVIPWRDVLYEGPVPAGMSPINLANERARYIAGRGWQPFVVVRQAFGQRDAALANARRHDEVVFWFEDDLYDGLQLAQAMDRVAVRRPDGTSFTSITLPHGPDVDCRALFDARTPVPRDAYQEARRLWDAFTSSDPGTLGNLIRENSLTTPVFDHTARAVLGEYPESGSGLSRSERQVLEAVATRPSTPPEVFRAACYADERPYLGDLQVWDRLHAFAAARDPLIRRADGGNWISPVVDLLSVDEPDMEAFARQVLEVTSTGREVLAGRRDWLEQAAPRWVGGVSIDGIRAPRRDQDVG